MSGAAATPVVGRGVLGYGGDRPPFTAVQWQELEQQAIVYKCLVAGLPVPSDLVMPIHRTSDKLSACFSHHPLDAHHVGGYFSYYGKKFDPEPGRCRRTDGKKWRCSKEAHPESKYCERHMHRGRNRSRKPVESQSTSQSLSTAISHISTGCSSNSGSSQHMPLYSVNSEGSSYMSNVTKLQMGPISHGIDNREFSFYRDASARVGSLGLGSGVVSDTWSLMPSQVSSTSLLKKESGSLLQGNSFAQQYVPLACEPIKGSLSKDSEQQQHSFFGNDIGSPATVKRGQHPVHLFFNEWPSTKDSWSNVDDDRSDQNVSSSTQLSISIPKASSDFPPGTAYSTNG